MKQIILIMIMSICTIYSHAQEVSINDIQKKFGFEIKNDGVVFTRNINVSNISSTELFNRIEEALYVYYKEPKNAIQMTNHETGVIISSHSYVALINPPQIIHVPYIMRIQAKNNECVIKIRVSKYETDARNKKSLLGFILHNHPFETINEHNNAMRVPDNTFDGVCNNLNREIERLEKFISEGVF